MFYFYFFYYQFTIKGQNFKLFNTFTGTRDIYKRDQINITTKKFVYLYENVFRKICVKNEPSFFLNFFYYFDLKCLF